MRAALACFTVLLSLPVGAGSNTGTLGKISEDLDKRGLTPAHVTLEYSLTDNCGLADLRIVDNSHADVLDQGVVNEIVRAVIGPFPASTPSEELIRFTAETESTAEKLSMTTRMISWNTNNGYRYVVCRFFMNGQLESARLTDGHGYLFDRKIRDQLIDQPLSELGPKTMRASFEPEGH